MKKSELRQIIKEEIDNELNNKSLFNKIFSIIQNEIFLQDIPYTENDQELDPRSIKDATNKIIQLFNDNIGEATIETSPENLAKVKQLSKPEDVIKVVKEEEEEEEDDSEDDEDKLDKKATAAAKKSNTKSKRLDSAIKSLKDLTNEMKLLAKDFTSSKDEKEKDKIKNILKEKTKIKKELEDNIKKMTNGIG